MCLYLLREGQRPAKYAFRYMSKVLTYYVVRAREIGSLHTTGAESDALFSEYVVKFEQALSIAYGKLPFDNLGKCSGIREVLEMYEPLFKKKYSR